MIEIMGAAVIGEEEEKRYYIYPANQDQGQKPPAAIKEPILAKWVVELCMHCWPALTHAWQCVKVLAAYQERTDR